jgi:hypothetical protein
MGTKILSRGYSSRGSEYDHSPQSSAGVRQEESQTLTDGVGTDSFIFTFIFSQRIHQTYYFILKESGRTKTKMKLMETQGKNVVKNVARRTLDTEKWKHLVPEAKTVHGFQI